MASTLCIIITEVITRDTRVCERAPGTTTLWSIQVNQIHSTGAIIPPKQNIVVHRLCDQYDKDLLY